MTFKLALIQMSVTNVKSENLQNATKLIKQAVDSGAQLIILPECFNSPYSTSCFPKYAEVIHGETSGILSKLSADNKIFLIGGSIPENEDGKIYNTCTVFNPKGELIAKHRKVHLVGINVPGRIRFKEADTLSPGNEFTTFDTPFCKIGVGICYDLRFPELAHVYGEMGCKLLVYPGAFNMATGPSHLEPLLRTRAIDNEVYVALVSASRDESAPYVTWGHSSVISPWGDVIATSEHKETIIYCDVNPDYVDQVREQLPILSQKRRDMYSNITCVQRK